MMATEYKLSYTATEINDKLGMVDTNASNINKIQSELSNISEQKADKTSIPSKTSQLTNDSGFLTQHQSLGEYAKKSDVPSKTSQLTNDSGFLTQHQSLSEYAKKATTLAGYGITDGAKQSDLDVVNASVVKLTAEVGQNTIKVDDLALEKVSKTDIVDSLESEASDKPLSAKQGNFLYMDLQDVNNSVGQMRSQIGEISEKIDDIEMEIPVKGIHYWTEADQEDIVQQVITALGTPVFGRVDADNNIILTGNLVEGTYTVKYEDENGKGTEIGTLNHSNAPVVTYTNLFDPATATLNTRMSGSSSAPKTENGYVMTATINIPAQSVAGSSVAGTSFVTVPASMWSGSANMFLGSVYDTTDGMCDANTTKGEVVGTWVKIPLVNQWSNAFTCTNITISLKVSGSAITASDIQNIKIYFNEIPGAETLEPTYTNLISTSIEGDGTPYNGRLGYKNGYRMTATGGYQEKADSTYSITGYIPIENGNVRNLYHLENIYSDDSSHPNITLYDENFQIIAKEPDSTDYVEWRVSLVGLYDLKSGSTLIKHGVKFADGDTIQLLSFSPWALSYWFGDIANNARYFRIVSAETMNDSKVIFKGETVYR